jgi:hypothetical protein
VEGNGSDLISVTLLGSVPRVERERERERETKKEFSVVGPRFQELPNMSRNAAHSPRCLVVRLMKNITVFVPHISDPSTFTCVCLTVKFVHEYSSE